MKDLFTKFRKNKLEHPNSYKIDIQKWKDQIGEPSTEIQYLIDGGIFIIEYKENIKKYLKTSEIYNLSYEALTENIVAYSNMVLCRVLNSSKEKKQDVYIGLTQNVDINPLSEIHPDALITKLLDSLRYHLCSAKNECKDTKKTVDVKNFVVFDHCGQMMENISVFWREMLWNDWSFKKNDFSEPKTTLSELRNVGHFRRMQMEESIPFLAHTLNWGSLKFPKYSFKTEKKKLVIKTIEIEMPNLFQLSKTTIDEYYYDLYDIPGTKGFTLREIMDVWEYLYNYANQHLDRLTTTNIKIDKLSDFNKYTVKVKASKLINAISKHSQIDNEKIKNIFNFLEFDNCYKSIIWEKPLIRLGDFYHLPIAVFSQGRARYMMELWLGTIGIDEKEKGTAFEKWLAKSLFPADINGTVIELINSDEEIDLIFRIGDTVWVCELKCNREPTDPEDFFNYREDLEFASTQLNRKIQYLQVNKNKHNLEKYEISTSGLIISNCFEYSGLEIGKNIVTDSSILKKYFNEPTFQTMVSTQGTKILDETVIQFYESEAEMIENFENYLRNPPQIEVFRQNMKYSNFPVGLDETIFSISRYEMDKDSLLSKLNKN